MTSQIEKFKNLHHQESPLLLGNAWNVQTALVYKQLGFKATELQVLLSPIA
jgi:2-methylisocitrate lyase-like PEP mutase family enzyme